MASGESNPTARPRQRAGAGEDRGVSTAAGHISRDLDGKVGIVTGAARGVGLGIATRFAQGGGRVVVSDVDVERGEQAAEQLRRDGHEAEFLPCDVRDSGSADTLVETVISRWGGVDVLCNNAGIGHLRSVTEEDDAGYDLIMDVNVRGIVNCCRAALPSLIERGGSIVNVASVAGFVGFRRDAVYCASKGAAVMLTKQMALDYGPLGVRVNAICPGFTETDQLEHYLQQCEDPEAERQELVRNQPLGRLARPAEMGAAAAFLASEAASFVNGVALPVDGGLLCH